MNTKVIHIPVNTHGELAELVGKKKRLLRGDCSMQGEVDKAVKRYVASENKRLQKAS